MAEQGTKTNQMYRPNDSIGTLWNYDGDSDGNFNFYTAKQQLGTSSPLFSTFLCHCYLTTTWNDRILGVLENGDGKTIVCTISVWTRTWSPLFNLISLFLSIFQGGSEAPSWQQPGGVCLIIVPWKVLTGQIVWMMLIMTKHFNLQWFGTDIIYEFPCYHDSDLRKKKRHNQLTT